MSEPYSEELLSAYVDGELSVPERAAVERWIELSPEARQQLEDFRRLSRLFGNLPRTEVPREFPTEVLQLAERRMLLPEAAAAHGRKRIRGWALALAAPTAAAAVLLLIFTISNRDDAAHDRPVIVADRTNREPAPAGFNDDTLSQDNETDPRIQAINEVVQEISESGAADKWLSVVTVFVADRAQGLVLLQEVFAANNIRIDSGEATEGQATDGAKPAGEASNEGLYVVAQADEFIAGFGAYLARQNPGARISVEPSIELAALDAESQKLFLLGEGQQALVDFRRGDAAAKDSKKGEDEKSAGSREAGRAADAAESSKPSDAGDKQNNKSSQDAAPRKKSPSMPNSRANQRPGRDKGTVEKSAKVAVPNENKSDEKDSPALPEANQMANNARQMVVPTLPPAIQNRGRSSGVTNSQAVRNLAGLQKQDAPIEAKFRDEKPLVQDEKLAEPALVRMLIVIELEPQRPDAPAAKKGPSGGAS